MLTMNAGTLRSEPVASEGHAIIRIAPLVQMRERWNEFAGSSPGATLYHHAAWTEALRQAYGFRILAATLEQHAQQIVAGCLLAPSKIPFLPRVVGGFRFQFMRTAGASAMTPCPNSWRA